MSKKRKDLKINPYTVLGVGDARAKEMSAEIGALDTESRYFDEVLTTLAERYDPESLVMGMFLATLIMGVEGRLSLPGARCTIIHPTQN